jgi:cytoskeletal protein CcmA (bactofilin family)
VEGTVEGTVRAGKAVVIGKDGVVMGDVITQDAIIGGRVTGAVVAESRLELQATCSVEGKVKARRIKLDEGGRINGTVFTGDISEGDMNSDIARPKGSARAAADTPEDAPAASA